MQTIQIQKLQEKIDRLKEEKNAIILAHNYQPFEVQQAGDFVGDSLELARAAQNVHNADIICFCGVDFMAETASILNPDKTVLLPDLSARCPMAAQLPAKEVIRAKEEHPGIPFVAYINTLAEAKAESDVLCTSSNAPKIVKSIANNNKVLFSYENSVLAVHPECDPEIQQIADFIGSTSQIIKFAKETVIETVIIATEIGLIEKLQHELPAKQIIPALSTAICSQMKRINLEKIVEVLEKEKNIISVPEEIAEKAEKAVIKMLELS
jgi:quinolinate synthase